MYKGLRCRSFSTHVVLKYVIVFLMGFYVHVLLDYFVLQGGTCSLQMDMVCPARERYQPKTKFEIIRYEYFDASHLYSNIEDDTKIGLLGYHKKELKTHIDEALEEIQMVGGFPEKIRLKELKGGYRRVEPDWGAEYILDLEVFPERSPSYISKWRAEISQPFCMPNIVVKPLLKFENSGSVHFIVPVNNAADRLRKFLVTFSTSFLSVKEDVSLTIVTSEMQHEEQLTEVKSLVKSVKSLYSNTSIQLLFLKTNFSRASALDMGAKAQTSDSLLFFVDADILVSRKFLHRCKQNAVRNQRVFYPIIFSQYKPSVVMKYSPKGKVKSTQDINKFTGHWVHYGYGMVCLYNSDYEKVGGFDQSNTGWGGEDVDLYQKHVHSNLEVFRGMEPGLIHRYHDMQCDSSRLSSAQWEACVGSLINTIGSKMQLALKILTEEGKRNQTKH